MADLIETSIEYITIDKHATFCSGERKWVNKINKLHEQYPDEVQIIQSPESNGGIILAHIPKSWLKVSPPKKVNMTEERKQQLSERLKKTREAMKKGSDNA